MPTLNPLPAYLSLIRHALREDIGPGDLTSHAVIPVDLRIRARILAKQRGVVAGVNLAVLAFAAVDRHARVHVLKHSGQAVAPGDTILTVEGSARAIFAAERVALNFLGHFSGIATLTSRFVRQTQGTRAKILDTRKTIPGLRLLQKQAVTAGGGQSHRLGLFDAVLIKTNHLRVMSGEWRVMSEKAIRKAVSKARQIQPKKMIEIEVVNLKEFRAALAAKPDAILLDNWRLADIKKAVALHSSLTTRHSPLIEVSGGVTLSNVRAIAKTGVDRISIGRLTHSAPSLDVSLEVF